MAAACNAVHAAMAGKTRLVIGLLHDLFIQIPIEMLALEKKHIDPYGIRWNALLAATGQPRGLSRRGACILAIE
jgi:6-phosphofructokinase 1